MSTVFLILSLFANSCKEKYINYILNDHSSYSCFITITIQDVTEIKRKVIIENYVLYRYLNEKEGIGQKKYQETIKRTLLYGEMLKIKDTLRWEEGFGEYRKDSVLEKVSQNDISSYLTTLFDEKGYLIRKFDEKGYFIPNNTINTNALICKLFEWLIPVRIDDITGDLYIEKSFKCN